MGLTERSPLKKVEALRESVAVVVREAQAEKRIVDAQVPTKKEVALVPTRNAARAATGALMLKKKRKVAVAGTGSQVEVKIKKMKLRKTEAKAETRKIVAKVEIGKKIAKRLEVKVETRRKIQRKLVV